MVTHSIIAGLEGFMKRLTCLMVLSLVFVTACGSSGRGRPRGKQCPSSYDPVSLTASPEGTQKVSLDPKDDQLPLGTYEYLGAEVYYHDSLNDIKIHVKEDVGPQGQSLPSNVCLRGLKPDMELQTAVYGIDKMVAESGGKSLFSVRKYQLNFKGSSLLKEFAEPTNEEKPASPHKLYQTKATEFSFVRLADASRFELRSTYTTGAIRQYLLIRYQLKTPAP